MGDGAQLLRRHVRQRAAQPAARIARVGRKIEVEQHRHRGGTEQHVGGLQIAMTYAQFVDAGQGVGQLRPQEANAVDVGAALDQRVGPAGGERGAVARRGASRVVSRMTSARVGSFFSRRTRSSRSASVARPAKGMHTAVRRVDSSS